MTVLKDEALSTSGGLGKSRLAAGLVVAQVALSLVLLTCAGLFVRSLNNAQKSDLGFDPNHVYLATFDLDTMGYSYTRGTEFDRQVLTRVRALPGVESATLADFSPLSFTIHSGGVLPEGYVPRPHENVEVDWPDATLPTRTTAMGSRWSSSTRHSSTATGRGKTAWGSGFSLARNGRRWWA
jgi:hypothetical protein